MVGHRDHIGRMAPIWISILLRVAALLVLLIPVGCTLVGPSGTPVRVGLTAPLSGRSGLSGQAIERGMLVAADEINREGGVLGRPVEIVTRDVPNDPARGIAAVHELIDQRQVVAVFGGVFSPVMLAQLDVVHDRQIPLINAWGSIDEITRNGRSPNFAFRMGLNDEQADEFLARYAVEVVGSRRPGLLADTTAWGESNRAGLIAAFGQAGVAPAGVERFEQGSLMMTAQLERLRRARADSLILVANVPEGAAIVRGLETLGWDVPVISHWGIGSTQFVQLAGISPSEGVLTLQTYSFLTDSSARAADVVRAYNERYGTRSAAEIPAPIGVAHGYDGLHILALAIERAETTDGPAVQRALEELPLYEGLVTRYERPFTREDHDPLDADDLLMAIWRNGRLVPAPIARLGS